MGPKLALQCISGIVLHLATCPSHPLRSEKAARMRVIFLKFFGMHGTEKIPVSFHGLQRGSIVSGTRAAFNRGKMEAPKTEQVHDEGEMRKCRR